MARPGIRKTTTTLEAVASPARQEVLATLGEGPATIRELAGRLGRSRQALYYHTQLLERAALVRLAGWRGEGRDRERIYRIARGTIAAGARADSAADLAAAERAVRAMLRLTGREVSAALRSGGLVPNAAVALRGKAHFDSAALARLHGLVAEIQTLLRKAKKPRPGRGLYAVTVVLTPVRQADGTDGINRKDRGELEMTIVDHLLVALLVIGVPIFGTISYRSLLRALDSGDRGAKVRQYWRTIAMQWGLVAAVAAGWWWASRPFAGLGLTLPGGSRLLWGAGITTVVLGFLGLQWSAIKRLDAKGREPLRRQLGGALGFLPRNDAEHQVFRLLAVTAGICEEILFRGFLIWYVGSWIGSWPAVAVTAAAFGLGHWYQGKAGVVKTGLVGLLAGAFYLATASLVWPMILHAAVDLQGGAVGRMIRDGEAKS